MWGQILGAVLGGSNQQQPTLFDKLQSNPVKPSDPAMFDMGQLKPPAAGNPALNWKDLLGGILGVPMGGFGGGVKDNPMGARPDGLSFNAPVAETPVQPVFQEGGGWTGGSNVVSSGNWFGG